MRCCTEVPGYVQRDIDDIIILEVDLARPGRSAFFASRKIEKIKILQISRREAHLHDRIDAGINAVCFTSRVDQFEAPSLCSGRSAQAILGAVSSFKRFRLVKSLKADSKMEAMPHGER